MIPNRPYNDPRNAVGFQLAAVLTVFEPNEITRATDRFVRCSVNVIGGWRRKGGPAQIFRELERVITPGPRWKSASIPPAGHVARINLLYSTARMALDFMDPGNKRKEWAPGKWWVDAVLEAGVARDSLVQLDIEWRFRDFVNRKRKSRHLKNAFRALWIAGECEMAERLIRKGDL